MSNITTQSSTSYPSGLDTRTTVSDDPGGTEVVSTHHNGPAAAILAIETELGTDPAGSRTDVVTRLNEATNSDGTLKSTLHVAGTGVSITYSGGVFTYAYSSDAAQFNQNVGLRVTQSSNALVAELLDGDLNPLSSTSPAILPFRSSTRANGGYNVRSVSAVTMATLTAGATLNFGNSETGRIYFYSLDNSGTVELAFARRAVFNEAVLQTTTAISAVSNGDQTLYSTTARSSVPVRLLGFAELTGGSTAGNWTNDPALIQLSGPNIPKTGDLVQAVQTTSGVGVTTAGITNWAANNTIPTVTSAGLQLLSVVMTPTSTINRARLIGNFMVGTNDTICQLALFDSSASGTTAKLAMFEAITASTIVPYTFMGEFSFSTIASTTYYVKACGNLPSTVTFNRNTGSLLYGGVGSSLMRIEEVFA